MDADNSLAEEQDDVSSDPVQALQRWQEAGAVWRVLSRTRSGITVGFFSCDGGEELARLSSEDPGLLAFVAHRASSDD